MSNKEFLPEPLPQDPLPLFAAWFAEARARKVQTNPDAMVLATVDSEYRPSARVVLCKQLAVAPGYLVFFTNYHSRKGRELAQHPHAAAVFHWDGLGRQVRVEGKIVQSPAAESDAYFSIRPLLSKLGAWASRQSEPLISRQQLQDQVQDAMQRFGVKPEETEREVPRPPHWGGYRLWLDRLELWLEGPGRVHDRARWTRTLTPRDEYSFETGAWSGMRLNP